ARRDERGPAETGSPGLLRPLDRLALGAVGVPATARAAGPDTPAIPGDARALGAVTAQRRRAGDRAAARAGHAHSAAATPRVGGLRHPAPRPERRARATDR